MKPGHPFETALLDELRAEQRRALRLLPRGVLAEVAPRVGPDLDLTPPDDRPFIEALLRAEARELLASKELARHLDSWRQSTQLEALDDFYERNRTRAEELPVGPQAAYFDQAELARNAHREAEAAPAVPVEHAPRFRRLLLLLVWADHLAGYRDPRLDALPPPAAAPSDVSAQPPLVVTPDGTATTAFDPAAIETRA